MASGYAIMGLQNWEYGLDALPDNVGGAINPAGC
jgi:hypothetical protein